MDFWPQTLDKYGKWQQFPTNIGNAVLQRFVRHVLYFACIRSNRMQLISEQ
jgi:hypothetical protein